MKRKDFISGILRAAPHSLSMIVYTKKGVKSKKSYARIYIREDDFILRLYLSNVNGHSAYIAAAPAFIQQAFVGEFPTCDHCDGKTECVHQKRYQIGDVSYEICDGKAFWFFSPNLSQMEEYLHLFGIFYPRKK